MHVGKTVLSRVNQLFPDGGNGYFFGRRTQYAVMPDADKTRRKDMKRKTADKFGIVQFNLLFAAAMTVILISKPYPAFPV